MVDVQIPSRSSPPRPPSPHRGRWPLATIVLVIVVGLVGIAVLVTREDESSPASDPVATEPSAPPTLPVSPSVVDPQAATKVAILDAYRQSLEAAIAVGSDPNGQPTDPRLQERKIGNALLALQVSITRLRNAGHVLRGDVESHPTVVELTGDTAVVEDCGVDQVAVINASTGEVVQPALDPPKNTLARATYRLIDGVWMQNGFKDLRQECVPAV